MTMDDPSDSPLARVRVVLVAPSHPGNVGAAARAMLAMGLERLVLVAPMRHPDPEAVARATGATAVLDAALVVGTLDAALDGVSCSIGFTARPREFAGDVLAPRDAAALAVASARAGREAAFVFGTEMSGLANDQLARCTAVATIPANPAFASLNLASAVQVAAYEARVAAEGDAVWHAPRFEPATHDAIEGLIAHAERTFVAMRFLHPEMPRRLMPRLRRLFARSGLEREEVNILRGILARIDQLIERRR
ncbi:tRNA (cytidine/uridine/adenosine-2'-O-)-methyltransferase TrmJ [Burkholderiales bacterium]|nr:tRNA (cytidine/uridine/adenosine-2'-O-)-methyltransferase TrmJ [Burkholderiales bacterium]